MATTIAAQGGSPFRAATQICTGTITSAYSEDHGRSAIITDIRRGATFPADGAWMLFVDESPQRVTLPFTDAVLPVTHVQPLWKVSSWA